MRLVELVFTERKDIVLEHAPPAAGFRRVLELWRKAVARLGAASVHEGSGFRRGRLAGVDGQRAQFELPGSERLRASVAPASDRKVRIPGALSGKVPPGIAEIPTNILMAAHLWGLRTIPGVGAFIGGQLKRGGLESWSRDTTEAELAFGRLLMESSEIDPKRRPATPNPRQYFADHELYVQMIRERGVPQTPEEAASFWWEYQWREYEKKVAYALAVGWDPGLIPVPGHRGQSASTIGNAT